MDIVLIALVVVLQLTAMYLWYRQGLRKGRDE